MAPRKTRLASSLPAAVRAVACPPTTAATAAQAGWCGLPEWYVGRLTLRFGAASVFIARLLKEHADLAARTSEGPAAGRRRSTRAA